MSRLRLVLNRNVGCLDSSSARTRKPVARLCSGTTPCPKRAITRAFARLITAVRDGRDRSACSTRTSTAVSRQRGSTLGKVFTSNAPAFGQTGLAMFPESSHHPLDCPHVDGKFSGLRRVARAQGQPRIVLRLRRLAAAALTKSVAVSGKYFTCARRWPRFGSRAAAGRSTPWRVRVGAGACYR